LYSLTIAYWEDIQIIENKRGCNVTWGLLDLIVCRYIILNNMIVEVDLKT
jgi:hypothetical protein